MQQQCHLLYCQQSGNNKYSLYYIHENLYLSYHLHFSPYLSLYNPDMKDPF